MAECGTIDSVSRSRRSKDAHRIPPSGDEMGDEIKTIRPVPPNALDLRALQMRNLVVVPAAANLPALRPAAKGMSAGKRWIRVAVTLAVVVGSAGAAFYWW